MQQFFIQHTFSKLFNQFCELFRDTAVFTNHEHMPVIYIYTTCNQLSVLLDVIFALFFFYFRSFLHSSHCKSSHFIWILSLFLVSLLNMWMCTCVCVCNCLSAASANLFVCVCVRVHIISIICVRFIYVCEISFVNFRVPFVRVFGVTNQLKGLE